MVEGETHFPLLVSASGKVVNVWDPAKESSTWSTTLPSKVRCVRWNHTSQVIGSAGEDGYIHLHHHSSGSIVGQLPDNSISGESPPTPHVPPERFSSIAFSKGSRYLATGGSSNQVVIWDLKRKVRVKALEGHTAPVASVAYSSGDQHIASGGASGHVLLHAQLSGTCVGTLAPPTPQGGVTCVQYSPHSHARHLLAASTDTGALYVWDTGSRSLRSQHVGAHAGAASAVCFSPSCAKSVLSGGQDKALLWLDLGSSRPAHTLNLDSPITALACKGDGVTLAAGDSAGKISIYDLRVVSSSGAKAATRPLCSLGAFSYHGISSLHWQHFQSIMPLQLSSSTQGEDGTPSPRALPRPPLGTVDTSFFSPLQDVKPLTPGGLPSAASIRTLPRPGIPPSPQQGTALLPTPGMQVEELVSAGLSRISQTPLVASSPLVKASTTAPVTSPTFAPSPFAQERTPELHLGGNVADAMPMTSSLSSTQQQNEGPCHVPGADVRSAAAPDPQVSGTCSDPQALGAASHTGGAGMSPFALQLFQRAVDDSMTALRAGIHEEIQNVHLEIIRQFTLQQQEMQDMMQAVMSRQDQLMEEVTSLKRMHQQQFHQMH